MAEKTVVIVYQKCIWGINVDHFINKRSVTDIKRLLRFAFNEWNRNVAAIEEIYTLVIEKKTEALIKAKVNPTDRQNKKQLNRYTSLATYIEAMESKVKKRGV